MSFPVKFNWVLQIEPPAHVEVGQSYDFTKPENRVFPIGTLIDLIDNDRQAIAKIRVTRVTHEDKNTTGSFTVVKIYQSPEKEILTQYWKENV